MKRAGSGAPRKVPNARRRTWSARSRSASRSGRTTMSALEANWLIGLVADKMTYNRRRQPSHMSHARPTRMTWVIFVAGAIVSWGAYGALLHMGQTQLGNPLKALLCVGVAYFLIGVLVPVAGLSAQGDLGGFSTGGLVTATVAGALGAVGAACIIWSFRAGGLPVYVMPLVFGGAPIVNVFVAMAI